MVGSWLDSNSPVVAELMARMGFDFLTVDAEHAPVDLPLALSLFQAIRSGNPRCEPIVRLPGTDYATTKRYLDAGAMGVIAPLVNTAAQAREVVAAVKYPPLGQRGVGFCRANEYGLNLEEQVAHANESTLVCVQIEHVDGVAAIEEILAVPGIDAVFIGPYDLSASLGVTGRFDHPDVVDAERRVRSACAARGIALGIHVVQPDVDETVRRYHEGYRLLAYSLDITLLMAASRDGLRAIRDRLPHDVGGEG